MPKMEPAELTMYFTTPTTDPGGVGNYTIDLSQCASLLNRRMYRQGTAWMVSSIKVFNAAQRGGESGVWIQKIPTSWVAYQAYKKAFNAWNRQQMEALADSDSEETAAKYRDFKIFMDTTHVTDSFGGNLLPVSFSATGLVNYTAGEWLASRIVLPNVNPDGTGSNIEPAQRFLHMVGTNVNGTASRGIIEGYADSRAYPHSPDPDIPDIGGDQNWMSRMFDVGNDQEEVVDNATLRNNDLPYPQENYPGGQNQAPNLSLHDSVSITSSTVGGTSRLAGGLFPCGLVRIRHANGALSDEGNLIAQSIAIQITLVPGDQRGYMTESMLEMV